MHRSPPFRPRGNRASHHSRRAVGRNALAGVLLAGTTLVLAQCTTRTVTGVDVGSVVVDPATATIVQGDELRFTAVVRDDVGNPLNGAAVAWASNSPSLLSIGSDGTALALQEGTTTVRATFQGVSGTANVTIQPGPEIVASPSSVALFGAVGGPTPDPAAVQITNGGAGSLVGLSASVEYQAGGETGWLSPGLSSTTAPATLALSAAPGTLPAGTYNATVVLSAQGAVNSPVRIPVLFSLTQGAPIIRVLPASLAFNAPIGSPTPDPVVVQVTNGGGGGLGSLSASVWYQGGDPGGWLSGSLGGTTAPTELTVTVDPTGLGEGVYSGEVRVASPNAVNSPQPVIVTLSVSSGSAGFTVTESGSSTTVSESGTSDDFTVVLDVAPGSDVVFNVSSSDVGEARVNPSRLTFTPANWTTPQTVTVTGVDDAALDGNQRSTVTVAVNQALSNDAFDPLPDQTVSVTTTDDDSPGFTVTESGGTTVVSESGTTDEVSIALNSAPQSNVVFTVSSDDTGEATVSPETITFTPAGWSSPQTVTVTGVDDPLTDGSQTTTVTVAVNDALSNNAYDGLPDQTVDVTTTDDDSPGFQLSPTTITVAEGLAADFTVVLNAQPASNVVFAVESKDVTVATVAPATLTFTPGAWNIPQAVTVTGVDDDVDDGDQSTVVAVSVDDAASDDAYDPLPDQNVDVTATDNDGAGFTISASSLTVEEGETTSFTAVLDARPTSQVVLTVTTSDATAATATPTTLTFTPGTWDNPKTVTVTGTEDALDDGDQTSTLTVAVDDANSDDAFDPSPDRTVTVTTTDDDSTPTAEITAPGSGALFTEGDNITFTGTGTDPEDGTLAGTSLVWTSSLDGLIGTGTSVSTATLSVGVHTIVLTVTDSGGLEDTDQIAITVNAPPVADITAPANGSSSTQGDNVTFSGTGTDPEDGALTGASLVWTSSLDDQIGTGTSFGTTTLSVGIHIITLTVTDSRGADDIDQITHTVTSSNQAPTANITAPANGSTFTVGDNVTFTGTGTDPEDGALTGASLVWTSSIDGQIGTGNSFSTTTLSIGAHIITLRATDSGSAVDTDQISITVNASNTAPTATITAPASGSTYIQGDNVTFTGTGTDPEDGTLTGASLVWTSNLDGQIGTGTSISTTTLSVGTHTITLTATDSGSLDDTDQITITVNANQAPTANITAPANGSTSTQGDNVTFTGTGTDPEDGTLTGASLVWTSSLDDQIGTGTSFGTTTLSVGIHIITLTVTDSRGLDDTDQITHTVTSSNQAPTANITAPANGSSFTVGDNVTFSGTGTDPEDGALTGASLVWTSTIDGQIGTGTSFSTTTLSIGAHIITLRATDSGSAVDTDQISITVNASNTAPTATITAPANGTTVTQGDNVSFTGTGTDPEDGTLTGASLVWTSNLNGQIGTGTSFSTTTLSAGTHTITLTATDSGSLDDTDQITITVNANQAPTANITAPANGSTSTQGDNVTFTGTGTDPEDGTLTGASLVWTSSLDDQIGTGTSFGTTTLSVGIHIITLTVTDSRGLDDTDQITHTVTSSNQAPTANITAPANGSSFTVGDNVTFSGTGTDPEDGALTGASLVWTSTIDGQIGTGTSFSTTTLSIGAHIITLRATDSGSAVDTDQISITVNASNTAPTATITAPANGTTVTQGDNVSFTGTGTDPEDGTLTGASLVWTSNLNGQIGTGTSFSTTTLSAGTHTITLTATDSGSLDDTDQITITVNANQAPTANITAPANGSTSTQGDNVTFTGTGTDPEDGTLTGASLVWTSSLDDQIGTGTSFGTTTLSVGIHIITLTVTDSRGLDDTDQITHTVTSSNQAPTANITAPANGSSFTVGDNVTFSGTGTDPEDGALTGASLVWTSTIDGQIGTGTSFSTTTLSIGAHIITLRATDSGSAVDTDQISITVNASNTAPTATITAPANGTTVTQGDNVSFTGTGTDPEDGTLTGASLVWTSNLNGQIGTGTSFSTTTLSVGAHIITLTATDSGSLDDTDQITITVNANQAPTANITAPANGSTSTQGDNVTFTGTGTDPEDGTLTGASLVWTSSIDAQIGTGTSFSTTTLSVGVHTVTLTVTDSGGADDTDQITVTVNAPPTATITAPANGTTVTQGDNVTFTGTGADTEDGALTGGSLVWTSNLDAQIGTGTSFSTTTLSVGVHTITLTVTDSDGADDTDQITVTVNAPNTAPTATITAPANGTTVTQGDNVTFTGTGTDPEDGTLTGGSLVWTSSLDAQIGTGTSFSTTTLSVGVHTITLTVTDSGALDDTDQITVTVNAPNTAPTATITAPANGTTVTQGDNVTFTGTGTDPEDGALTGGSLVWTSSIDAQIGTGISFSTTTLSVGVHTITLTATDSGGLDDIDQITVTVNAPQEQLPEAFPTPMTPAPSS